MGVRFERAFQAVVASQPFLPSSPQALWRSYPVAGDAPPTQSSALATAQLETQCRDAPRALPFSGKTTPRQLWRQWAHACPSISASESAFKQRFQKQRAGAGAAEVSGYKALEALAGDRPR
eukprot:5506511-Pyramimonas_sp.AAC.1